MSTIASTQAAPEGVEAPAPAGTGDRRPLWHHALALTVVLLALTPLLGGRGLFSGDEGAALAQAQLLADGEGWGFDVPRPDLDPDGEVAPFDRADPVTGAPFSKHPAYPVLLVPFVAVAGTFGAKLASVLGAVGAALAAAALAERLRPGTARAALWVAGLASPLLFNGWLVIAHAPAAAACGLAAVVVLDALDRPRPWRTAVAVAALLVGILLRNEAVLFGVALAVAVGAAAARRRTPAPARLGVALLGASGLGWVLDSWLTGLVAGPEPPFVVGQTLNSSNYVAGRVLPTTQTLVAPVRGAVEPVDLLVVVALISAVAAAVIVRRHPEDRGGIMLCSMLAAGAGLLRLFGPPTAVPGLLSAFPLLPVGLLLMPSRRWRDGRVLTLAVTTVLFVGAVLATQYETGGTAEWGFRYAAVGLPLMVALAVVGLVEGGRDLAPGLRRLTLGALVVLSASLALLSVRTLDHQHRITLDAVAVVEDVRAQSDRPVVVTSYLPLGRMAWEEILAGEDWTLVAAGDAGEEETADLAARITRDGGDVVLVSQDPELELAPWRTTHEVVTRVPAVPSGQIEVLRLVPR